MEGRKVLNFGKKDVAKKCIPISNKLGIDTVKPETCDTCIYFKDNKCRMPGGSCGKNKH